MTEKRFFEWHEDDISVTLRNKSGSYGGGSETLVISNGEEKELSAIALETFHCVCEEEKVMPLKARDYKDAHSVLTPKGEEMKTVVRRLTPLECERLQGFPDGWTNIGDWTDGKGKLHKGDADSPRYKALGNSIATPYWFYLLRRISAQYERPATMGSLFDGIGGFPYCWERCNGKGTAIWASEIEEFPIAVTKKHFSEKEGEDEE